MADAAMVPFPPAGQTGISGAPTGGLAALKYAAQADVFQDDPNFYTWLEDWIGKQDEEAVMIDAFNTLNDYGMQFEFQQQQQQQQLSKLATDMAGPFNNLHTEGTGAAPMSFSAPSHPGGPGNALSHMQAQVLQLQQQQQSPGGQDRPQGDHVWDGGSSSASLASHPSAVPSGDSSSMNVNNLPADSLCGVSASPYPASAGCLSVPRAAGPEGSGGPSRSPAPCPPAPSAAPGADPGQLFMGVTGLSSQSLTACRPSGLTGGSSVQTPFDATSFIHPLSRVLEPQGVMSELQTYLRRDTEPTSSATSLMQDGAAGSNVPAGGRFGSHGTVSSYMGAPPPPSSSSAGQPVASQLPSQSQPRRSRGPPASAAPAVPGDSLCSAGVMVPSLEQLIVRAICGNGSDFSRTVGNAGGLMGFGSLFGPNGAQGTQGGMAGVAGLNNGAGGGSGGVTGGNDGASAPGMFAFARNSKGSTGDEPMLLADNGAGVSYARDSSTGESLLGSMSAFAAMSAGGPAAAAAAAGSDGGKAGSGRYRRKSSSSALTHGSGGSSHGHQHGGGIPVSHAHGHGHVGKVAVAGWARGGAVGGAAGSGAAAAAGGGTAGGRMTRSARTKAVFAALEAEVAGKMGELENLQREHATLAQRVEILEVAVERQNVVLNLMQAARAGAAAAAVGASHGSAGVSGGLLAQAQLPQQQNQMERLQQLSHVLGGAVPQDAAGMICAVDTALSRAAGSIGLDSQSSGASGEPDGASRAGSCGVLPAAEGAGACAGAGAGVGSVTSGKQLSPVEVLAANPGTPAASDLLEWARKCTVETYAAWYKEHLQNLSLALLALEDGSGNPEAETRLVQLVAACWVRTTLTSVFQPLTMLRLKGINLETGVCGEPSEQHWMEVIKFMTVSPDQVSEMENLFHSYNLLHDSFRAELQDTQRDLAELVGLQEAGGLGCRKMCTDTGLSLVLQQTALLKRVRSILQKTHLLYSCTIGVAAMKILKPKEFAKCCVQSYPYYPCGPSLMRACAQLCAMKAIWGVGGCR